MHPLIFIMCIFDMIQTSMQCDVYKLGFVHNTCIFTVVVKGLLWIWKTSKYRELLFNNRIRIRTTDTYFINTSTLNSYMYMYFQKLKKKTSTWNKILGSLVVSLLWLCSGIQCHTTVYRHHLCWSLLLLPSEHWRKNKMLKLSNQILLAVLY